jgi:hypothetical protein
MVETARIELVTLAVYTKQPEVLLPYQQYKSAKVHCPTTIKRDNCSNYKRM